MRGPALVSVVAAAVVAPGLAAQPLPDGYAHSAAADHPRGTMVAVALRLPVGSRHDQAGIEGTAWLLAQVLRDAAAARLDAARTTLDASVGRSHTVFTLLTVPDGWQRAWRVVDSVLFGDGIDPALLEAHREALLERLAFERGAPVRLFEREALGLLGGVDNPWSRPLRGTEESVSAVGVMSLELLHRGHYRREAAAVAVAGPVGVPTSDRRPSAEPPPPPSEGPAWHVGDRILLEREVTNSWIAAAYPVDPHVSRTALELVAHLVLEELDPVPPDPARYSVDVRLENAPGGPVLMVEASVLPEAADRWEARIVEAVAGLSDAPLQGDFFRWRRRRFRTVRLLEETAPEREARRMTADLLRTGVARDLSTEIWRLDPEAVREAAAALGEPRILRMGPDLTGLQGRGAAG